MWPCTWPWYMKYDWTSLESKPFSHMWEVFPGGAVSLTHWGLNQFSWSKSRVRSHCPPQNEPGRVSWLNAVRLLVPRSQTGVSWWDQSPEPHLVFGLVFSSRSPQSSTHLFDSAPCQTAAPRRTSAPTTPTCTSTWSGTTRKGWRRPSTTSRLGEETLIPQPGVL